MTTRQYKQKVSFVLFFLKKIKMFLIHFNNFCIAKKSKLSTVRGFCTHFHRDTVLFENNQNIYIYIGKLKFKKIAERKNLFFPDLIKLTNFFFFLMFLHLIIIDPKNWTKLHVLETNSASTSSSRIWKYRTLVERGYHLVVR